MELKTKNGIVTTTAQQASIPNKKTLQFNFNLAVSVGLFKKITPKQKEAIDAIVKAANEYGVTIPAQLAYMLATTYHECYNWDIAGTDGRMVQLIEKGGDTYLKGKSYWPYVGRGPSHLTWGYNYKMEGERLGINFLKNPELIMDLKYGAPSHVYCMMNGSYRKGEKLTKYINSAKTDFPNAREIINPDNNGVLVAGYASKFLKCISFSS